MQNAKSKYGKITNIRAVAIILVIIGHSIIIYSSNWDRYTTTNEVYVLDRLKDWINLVQMPLFFSISGFLFEKNWGNYDFMSLIRNKMHRLLIPWLCVGLGWMIPIRIFVGYKGYAGAGAGQILRYFFFGQDDGHMWFLPALFICFVMAYSLKHAARVLRLRSNTTRIITICIAYTLLRKSYLISDIGMLRDAANYFFYFEVGAILAEMKNLESARIKAAGFLAFSVCTITALAVPISPYSMTMVMIKTIMVISAYVIMPIKTNSITEAIGRYSFGLYLFHSPLVYITYTYLADASPVIVVAWNLIGGGMIAVAITYIIKRSPARFILGENNIEITKSGSLSRSAYAQMDLRNILASVFIAVTVSVLASIQSTAFVFAEGSGTKIHFICVTDDNAGEDAILIESNGRFGFIDCGRWRDRVQIKEAMTELGVTHDNLEFVIGTHAHADHIGFLNDIMKEYAVERIYLLPFTADCLTDPSQWTDTSWQNAMDTADRLGVPVVDTFLPGASDSPWDNPDDSNRYTASPHFVFGEAEVDIYNYSQAYLTEKVDNANDCSLVVKVTAGGHTALITGDLSNAEGRGSDPGYDESMIASELGHVDILKLPHHGYRWNGTNDPDDLAAFSPEWFIQTGSFDLLDYNSDGRDTLDEILRQCRNGSRFLSTSWYNNRIMKNGDSVPAITINMTDLSCNVSDDYIIAASDKDGNIYKFRAGLLTDELYEGNKTYLSTGRSYDNTQIIHVGSSDYAVTGAGLILNNSVEIDGNSYTCDPDNGTCVPAVSNNEIPEIDDPTEIKPYDPDEEIEGAYFADWDRQDMVNALNKLRQDNGVPALSLSEDQTYADIRALEFAKKTSASTADAEKNEVFIPCFGSLSPEEAISRTMNNKDYRNIYLGKSYRYIACSCFIKPLDIAYATIFTIEFYEGDDLDEDMSNSVTGEDLITDIITGSGENTMEAEERDNQESPMESGQSLEELLKENNELLKQLINILERILEMD